MRNILPEENRLKESFYSAKSMMKPLGLGYQKINTCPNFCMLYYLENVELSNILPEENRLKESFYSAKSMMKPLGLGYQKINTCPNFCMLYYLENVELSECRTCRYAHCKPKTNRERTLIAHRKLRYFSITPMLQKLFMSPKTIEHMIYFIELKRNYCKCYCHCLLTDGITYGLFDGYM